jgi:hypothetical protein
VEYWQGLACAELSGSELLALLRTRLWRRRGVDLRDGEELVSAFLGACAQSSTSFSWSRYPPAPQRPAATHLPLVAPSRRGAISTPPPYGDDRSCTSRCLSYQWTDDRRDNMTTYYRLHRCPGCDFECLTSDEFRDHLVERHRGSLPSLQIDDTEETASSGDAGRYAFAAPVHEKYRDFNAREC